MKNDLPRRREPSCVLNHDAMRRELREKNLPPTACPDCDWVLSPARDGPTSFSMIYEEVANMTEEELRQIVEEIQHRLRASTSRSSSPEER